MTSETRYRPHPARSFSRAIHALLVVCALVAPSALWAQAPNCNPGETVTQIVEFTKKRIDSSDSIGPLYELQGWFEFDPIPEVAQYRLDITEFSINTSPPTLGRRFFYNTTNPPTRVDVYSLHRTSAGTLGVIVIHASGRPPSNAPAFWAGITGKAELTYTCPTPKIDIEVLATSTLTGSGDNLKATFTATLTNKGTKTAENVELTVKLLEQDGPSGSAFGASSASVWLHVLSADSRCDQQLGFLTGKVVCRGISIAGGDVKFLEFVTRVVNASDLKDRVTMTAVAPGDIDNSNNEDKTKVTPNLVGTMADTLEAMEALAPYFDYRATPGTGGSCDRFMNDIFNRLEAIRAENPSVFANLSYGRITSGAYNWAPIDNELTRAGHVGVVVYLKGSDYHETGIVIHGTPTWSPYAMLPVLGTLCYGFSGNIVKHHLYMLPASATAALALTFVGPIGAIGCWATDLTGTLERDPDAWRALGYVAVLAVMSSAISLVMWNALLKRTSAVWASSVTYLMPVVAIGWGLLDGEPVSWKQFVMIGLILAGVYLVTASRAGRE